MLAYQMLLAVYILQILQLEVKSAISVFYKDCRWRVSALENCHASVTKQNFSTELENWG